MHLSSKIYKLILTLAQYSNIPGRRQRNHPLLAYPPSTAPFHSHTCSLVLQCPLLPYYNCVAAASDHFSIFKFLIAAALLHHLLHLPLLFNRTITAAIVAALCCGPSSRWHPEKEGNKLVLVSLTFNSTFHQLTAIFA